MSKSSEGLGKMEGSAFFFDLLNVIQGIFQKESVYDISRLKGSLEVITAANI